jgi:excinuclease ABC subunit C
MELLGRKIKLDKNNLRKVHTENGIYIFWNSKKSIYIGKSVNLKNRLQSYLSSSIYGKTKQMISEAETFSIIKVASELEALLLEAKLVNKIKPKYNSQLKDDKRPLFILITREKYPRVLTARKKDLNDKSSYFGPFPSSKNVRDILKLLRRIFPYAQHKLRKKKCFYNQIGLCKPCPSSIEQLSDEDLKNRERRKYLKNIRRIRAVLTGKFKAVRNGLVREMEKLAFEEKFEEAVEVRSQIEKLDYVTQPITPVSYFLKNPNFLEDLRNREIKNLRKIISTHINVPKLLRKIECYDVAHLAGSYPTASMVTFISGVPDKSLYRHFRIRQKKGASDADSLREVIKRRVKHFSDWGVPDLIIVDGGKPQVSVFLEVLKSYNIPVVGIAKRTETLIIPQFEFLSKPDRCNPTGSNLFNPSGCLALNLSDLKTTSYKLVKMPKGPALNLVKRLRDEAHRFARRYHHKLLQKEFLQK